MVEVLRASLCLWLASSADFNPDYVLCSHTASFYSLRAPALLRHITKIGGMRQINVRVKVLNIGVFEPDLI